MPLWLWNKVKVTIFKNKSVKLNQDFPIPNKPYGFCGCKVPRRNKIIATMQKLKKFIHTVSEKKSNFKVFVKSIDILFIFLEKSKSKVVSDALFCPSHFEHHTQLWTWYDKNLQKCRFLLWFDVVTLKYGDGHWKWYEWVTFNKS